MKAHSERATLEISFLIRKDNMKRTIKDVSEGAYQQQNTTTYIPNHYHIFYMVVAAQTQRLSRIALSMAAEDLYQLSGKASKTFGGTLSDDNGLIYRSGGKGR